MIVPWKACGSGPCRPSLALSERSEWATADRERRGPGLRTGFQRPERDAMLPSMSGWAGRMKRDAAGRGAKGGKDRWCV